MDQRPPGVIGEFPQMTQDMIGNHEGPPEPVEVKLFGDDEPTLERIVDQLGPRMEKIPGLVDYKAIQKGNPEIVFHVDPARAGRNGLSVEQVSQQVRAGLLGLTETAPHQTDLAIDIPLRFPDS